MDAKTCNMCQVAKPLGEFNRHKARKDGRDSKCRECAREYNRRWHAANADRKRESNRRWREENRDRVRENSRRWHAANPDRDRENSRRWYAENRDRARENTRRWRAENAERERERKRIRNQGMTPELRDYMASLKCKPCHFCGGPADQVDHLTPVSRCVELGIPHNTRDNLAPICGSCNISKGAKTEAEFIAWQIQIMLAERRRREAA
ncbi:HNH endonuclease [Streptomyces sp. S1A]|uniref:HNH endonuclease signature motif containing protein n=1 Tax=Streptomyces sp. ICN903 TaxID=2964654 RepID=UPI001EDA98BA|nr:HNH endonuclease [Streptomyces sp. ICN903]MCG3042561.1 HNH endonuclease [Streptomyces sp. ICN903]